MRCRPSFYGNDWISANRKYHSYMVTEWVEKGDMFDFINWNGALREEEALFYFRQMMSAIGYCHSLGICHRDLKPENILLKADGTVKIADFGMAALQQNPSHQLRTACGSPHYAAPELLRHQFYKGSAVDIWSLGVILYAMLAGCLPFDDEDVNLMLSKALKADFTFPRIISHEARDLISKILVPQPAKRITMKQMWKHPLIRKYSYLDDLHLRTGDVPRNADAEPVPEHEICPQILRQLCSLWHGYTEDHLKTKLTQDKPNDQKLFYWLLLEHREGQLENYNRNQVPISKSDHHHLKPPGWTRRVATCHFADENEVGPSRGGSKFTVVSSVSNPVDADDSATVQSYDPFNASRDPQLPAPKMALPKVTVHRNDGESDAASMKTNTTRSYHAFRAVGGSFQKVNSQALISKHKAAGSTASSLRSAHSNTPRVVPNSRSKRGVNFSAIRNAKRRGHQHNKEASGYLQAAVIHQETTSSRNAERQVAAQKTNSRSGPKPRENVSAKAEALRLRRSSGTPREDSEIWNEELQKHSRLIAEDCDKAFQSSLIFAESALEQPSREASPFSLSLDLGAGTVRSMSAGPIGNLPVPNQLPAPKPWDNRPLPPTPAPSVTPVPTTRNFSMHITPIPKSVDDRRIVSEPVRSEGEKHAASLAQKARHVPSVTNASSYCPKTPTAIENQGLDALGPAEQTIRFVHSPSAVPVPAPLKVRKVSAQDRDSIAPLPLTTVGQARDRAAADRGRDESDREKVEEAHDRVVSWFKRGEKQDEVIAALDRETIRRASKQKAATKEDVEVKSKSKGKELAKASSKEREVEKRASKEKPKEKSKDKSKDERKSCDKKELSVDEGSSIKKKGGFRFSFALWKKEKEKAKDEKPVEGKLFFSAAECLFNPPIYLFNLLTIANELTIDNHSVSISSDGRATAKQHPKASKQKLSAQISVWKDEDNTSDEGSITGRQIEVHQNWLFRLLRVKPAQRHMCLILPRQRARQEIAIQLRQWRQYGIRDVEVDKERNLIFARVAAKNCECLIT